MRATKEQLETISRAIDGCLQITRSADLVILTQILSMARLELRLRANAITDEEFQAYCSTLDETLDQRTNAVGERRDNDTGRNTGYPVYRSERKTRKSK